MAFNRDLSQLANFLEINSDGTFVNIIPSTSQTNLGIGTNNPTAKLDVLGNARVSGNLSAGNINASGIVTATNGFVGNLTGLASSATQLATGRTIAITGDLTYTSGSFNGTGNVTGTGTLANTTVTPGSYGSSTEVATFTVDSKGRLTAAGTASVGTALTVAGDSGSENISLLSEVLTISGGTNLTSSATSNTVTVNLDPNISLTSVVASGVVTATSGFSGNVTGNLTGEVNSPSFDTNASGVVITGITTSSGGFVGALTGNVTGNVTGNINSSGVSTVTSLNATNINASGIITATSGFVGNLTGLASSATQLQTSRNFSISGDATASSISFNGTANVGLALTLANTAVTPGSYGSSTEVATFTVDSKGRLTAAGTASVGTALTVTGDSGSENISLLSESLTISGGTNLTSSAASNTVTVNLDPNISLTSVVASGVITATSGFSGNVTGNINSSGVSTVTSLNATNINASGIVTATSGFVGNLTGLASSATKLATGRTVAITGDLAYTSGSFDGTGNVTGTGTLATVNSNVGSFGSQTLIPVVTVNAKGLVTSVTTAAVGTALTVTGDSGSENIDLLTETLTISGGTNLTSSAASNSVTVNLDPNISLTSVVASGIITATSGFVGNLTGNINSSGVSTVTSLNATNINASGIVTATQFKTGASGSAIGINTNTISGPATITIDPAGVGDNTGAVRIKGDLFVDGTQFIVNSTTIELADFVVGIASTATTDILADGAGIKIGPDNTLTYDHTNTALKSSENFNVASGKTYKINGTDVLSATTLGSGIVASSLTSVGTLTNLSVGNVNSSGIITATSGFVGNLTGNINSSGVSTVTNLNIGGYVSIGNTIGAANQVIASTGVGVTWKTFEDLLPQTRTGLTTSATASQTLFSFVYNVNFLDVFVNGVKLSSGEFTASNGTTITLAEGAFANDTVEFVSYNTVGAGTGQVSSLNDLTDVTLSGITTGNILAYNGSEFVNTSNINVTGIITATTFVGALTGTATSTTNIPNLTGDITSVNSVTSIAAGVIVNTDINASAAIAVSKLAASTISGVTLGNNLNALTISTGLSGSSYNGSGAVTIAIDSTVATLTGTQTLTNKTLTSPTLTTPALGTPSSGTLTSCTGLPVSTGISGLGANVATFLATPSSANLISAVTDETGSGALVFATSPTLVTPALGTPASGTLTSCTGLPLTTGVTGTLPVANGGTGVTASTGTGSVVLSASPTFTGTVGAAAITATGDIAAANFNSTSDINLKENIRQVESASELVSKLEGVHFSWKETGKETIGVIAQQIEEHLPQLVQTGDTHKTVNYNGLIGVLIEAVKEQGAQIAALQAEIEELKK